uniref:Ionotropic receptor 41a n=1 Tax=Bradysia odoriphaga TaxID=1564500 RepID=A0A6B9C9U3_9DIPT|nr:ionotropic receptor 41a [Bradysia odoriphaga]
MESAILSGSGSLEQLLTHIILKYFIQLYCVCVVSNTLDANHMIEINFNWIHEGEKYPQMIWLKYDAQESNQSNVDDLIRMSIDSGCQAFIASPNTVIDFLDAFENVRFTSKNRYHLVHVVALPTSTDKSAEYIQEILNHPSVQDIPNILIISPSVRKNETAGDFEGRFYDLITSTFVSRYNSQDRRLLDTFDTLNERFVDNANLFPEKFSDLEGRPVRLAMLSYNPNSLWEKVPAGFGNANLVGSDEEKNMITDGTETTMITSFCDVYNCTSTIFPADGVGDWGTIEDNYTGDGVLGAVVERRADIGVGAFYLWHHEFLFLDFSMPISRSGVSCVCPKPSRRSGWFLPVEPFSIAMWNAELITFVGIFVAITIIKGLFNNVASQLDIGLYFTETVGIIMLQSININSNRMPEVILRTITLLACVLIASAYGGGLASIMTVPQFEPPIDSTHQMVLKNIEWGITDGGDAWVYDLLDATEPDLIRMVELFVTMPYKELEARIKTRDYCFVLERLRYGHYAVSDYINEESLNNLRLMRYDIYWGHCVAMFYKTWPFKSVFDLHVLHVIESGIQKFWELGAILRHSNAKVQLGISISSDREKPEPVNLSLDHVSGAFAIFGIGCTCAVVAFIIESIYYRNRKRKIFAKHMNTQSAV